MHDRCYTAYQGRNPESEDNIHKAYENVRTCIQKQNIHYAAEYP
jgi:hypothetical protein